MSLDLVDYVLNSGGALTGSYGGKTKGQPKKVYQTQKKTPQELLDFTLSHMKHWKCDVHGCKKKGIYKESILHFCSIHRDSAIAWRKYVYWHPRARPKLLY